MQAGSDRGSEWSMVSSRSVASEQHVRGSRGQKRQCQDHGEKSWRATVQTRSHGVVKLLNHHLYVPFKSYSSCELTGHHCDDTFDTVLYCLDCTLTADAHWSGTVDHSRPDCFISGGQQSQDRRTKVSASGKQLLGYVGEYVHSWPPILSQVSSHRRGSASKRPPRACSTCVPRKANRTWLTSHCMSLVAAADSETTHTAE
jgi:hypothetical protein